MAGTFFSDFDGTITDVDFYELVLNEMDPELEGDPIGDFYRGELPLFETLRQIFAGIRLSEEQVLAMLPALRPDPHLAVDFARLHDAGWELHVVSAGSAWYIEHTFEQAGVDVPVTVHANPGRFETGLIIDRPADPRIAREEIGVDKAAVVEIHGKGRVAFAGNSQPDLAAASSVPADLRFARGSLCDVLEAERLAYRRFERWHEVAEALLA
ncbi:MAG: HAD-IB family phosphatase [Planctomycetota bacterium]|jgi:HAD superfamily phosphoserine phosphatase-like hydrolase